MTTDNFCFYLQNRLIQTSQTVGQQYSVILPPLVFPAGTNALAYFARMAGDGERTFFNTDASLHVDDEDEDYKPSGSAVKSKPKKTVVPEATETIESSAIRDSATDTTHDDSGNSEEPRSKRARKEKKIFDL